MATRFEFYPAFHRGHAPFGTWYGRHGFLPKQWKRHENNRYDYGAVSMRTNRGVTLQQTVGSVGFAWDANATHPWSTFGYPSNQFGGQRLAECDGRLIKRDRPQGPGPPTVGVNCDLGPGGSGGGWFVDGYLSSVESYQRGNNHRVSYGPYFNRGALQLIQKASRG